MKGLRILVVGLGRSGLGAARLAAARGAIVTVTDAKPREALEAAISALPPGVRLELGGHLPASFLGADLVVVSPGVPPLSVIAAAVRAGVPVIGELEFAAREVPGTIVGVSGTNGKSTTTALVAELLRGLGRPVFLGGNLGTPLSEAALDPVLRDGVLAVEASSFQLETVERWHARAAVVTNLVEDHVDRHPTMEHYATAKARLFVNQNERDLAVLNADDAWTPFFAARTRARQALFSSTRPLDAGAWLEGRELRVRHAGRDERYGVDALSIVGRHNHENALAALLVAHDLGVPSEAIRAALAAFRPLPHRLEKVAEARGIAFYDDSKATNVHSVVKGLDGFPRPVVLIAGGRDKHGDLAPLSALLPGRVRALVLIGEAADRFAAAFAGLVPMARAGSMDEAVRTAAAFAQPGDAVLLSPACASFDMFTDYAHRGRVFAEAARRWST